MSTSHLTRSALIQELQEESMFGLEAPPEAEQWPEQCIRAYFDSDGEVLPKDPAAPWVHKNSYNPIPVAPRIYCFHASGSSAGMFNGWDDQFPGVEIVPLELPGHGVRAVGDEMPVGDVHELVEAIAADLFPTSRPYAILGVSSGALLAYELALEVTRRGCPPPSALFILSEESPHTFVAHGSTAGVKVRDALPMSWNPDAEFKQDLMASPFFELDEELLDTAWGLKLMRRCRAGLMLEENYLRHGLSEPSRVECRLVCYYGTADAIKPEEILPWEEMTAQGFSVHPVEGGEHMFMQRPSASAGSEQERVAYQRWCEEFRERLAQVFVS